VSIGCPVRRDTLETTILHGLQHHLMDPVLFKEFAEAFYEEVNRLRSQRSATQDAKRQELARIEQRIRRIADAIADGAQARALKDELLALEDRQVALHTALRNVPEPAPLIHPNLAEIDRRKVAALHEALKDTETRTEAFEANDVKNVLADVDADRRKRRYLIAGFKCHDCFSLFVLALVFAD